MPRPGKSYWREQIDQHHDYMGELEQSSHAYRTALTKLHQMKMSKAIAHEDRGPGPIYMYSGRVGHTGVPVKKSELKKQKKKRRLKAKKISDKSLRNAHKHRRSRAKFLKERNRRKAQYQRGR